MTTMSNEHLESLSNFMYNELVSMKDNIINNYDANIEKRKNNVFLALSDKTMTKYMALGRSVDSQLGNRMQRIIFYAARLKYGNLCVPNIVSINILNEAKGIIKVDVYSVPLDLKKDEQKVGFNPFNQIVFVSKTCTDDSVKSALKIKKKSKSLLSLSITCEGLSDKMIKLIKSNKKKMPVDLLLLGIDKDNKEISNSTAFEIKMGGNLDTKNAKSNAEEVKNLSELFSFLDDSKAYFATCYGECSVAVKRELNTILNNESVLNGIEFWKKVLPDSFTFDEFIEAYKDAFVKSSLEKDLKSLK